MTFEVNCIDKERDIEWPGIHCAPPILAQGLLPRCEKYAITLDFETRYCLSN